MPAEPERFAELFNNPSIEAMHALLPREFERFVAYVLRRAGYNVKEVGPHWLRGVDLEMRLPGKTRIFGGVECKRYAPDQLVTAPVVRGAKGASAVSKTGTKPFVITTSDFNDAAHKLAKDGAKLAYLLNGEQLIPICAWPLYDGCMGRRLRLESHLEVEELERRYRAAKEPHERSWWQILWLLAKGQTATAVAEGTGYSRYWIGQLVRRYNVQGPEAMRTRQYTHSHRPALLLSADQLAELAEAVRGPAPEGEDWLGRTVAAWMSQKLGRPMSVYLGWAYLVRLDGKRRTPRPRHVQADAEQQAAFKKSSARSSRPSRPPSPTRRLSSGRRTNIVLD